MRHACLAALLALAVPFAGAAELEAENLLQALPAGYKIDFQARQGNMLITEMVPQAESVQDWTEMVTTQVFRGLKNATPEQFETLLTRRWLAACKGGEAASVTQGEENGYPFALWVLACPANPATGKPEITWFKAIRGNDSFYVVQKAFKFEPAPEAVVRWTQYLRQVTVCDTRLPERPCPKPAAANP